MSSTVKKIGYAIIKQNETGKDVNFKIPLRALTYNPMTATERDLARIQKTMDKCDELHYACIDSDRPVFDANSATPDEDRIEYIRQAKKGVWI